MGWRTEEGLLPEQTFILFILDDSLCSHPALHPTSFPDCLWKNSQPFGSADICFFNHGLSMTRLLSLAQLASFVLFPCPCSCQHRSWLSPHTPLLAFYLTLTSLNLYCSFPSSLAQTFSPLGFSWSVPTSSVPLRH